MNESENKICTLGWVLALAFFVGTVAALISSSNSRRSAVLDAKESQFDKEQEAKKPDSRFSSSGSEPMGVHGPWVSVFTDSKTKRQYLFVMLSTGGITMVLMPEENP